MEARFIPQILFNQMKEKHIEDVREKDPNVLRYFGQVKGHPDLWLVLMIAKVDDRQWFAKLRCVDDEGVAQGLYDDLDVCSFKVRRPRLMEGDRADADGFISSFEILTHNGAFVVPSPKFKFINEFSSAVLALVSECRQPALT